MTKDEKPKTVAEFMAKAKAAGHDALGIANDPEAEAVFELLRQHPRCKVTGNLCGTDTVRKVVCSTCDGKGAYRHCPQEGCTAGYVYDSCVCEVCQGVCQTCWGRSPKVCSACMGTGKRN